MAEAKAWVMIPKLRDSTDDEVNMVLDMRPLVLCKDCKYWHESEMHKGYGDCGQANGITLKSSDWFCADGERS